MHKVFVVFGTRPEAIKLSPVVLELQREPREFDVRVCVTGQHRHLLDQVLPVFGIKPHHDLNVMLPGQTLTQSTTRILLGLEPVLREEQPDLVVVQGDTTTTLCGALAAFYQRIPVAHVEAGLRTGDLYQPFPEESNRVLAGRLARLHFAATQGAADNLLREGIPAGHISVTGNSGIDAVLRIKQDLEAGRLQGPEWPWLDPKKRLVLVTAHRRESFGQGFRDICAGLARIAAREDVQLAYPVHPNPQVQEPVNALLRGLPRVHLIEPLGYVPFIDLMRRATLLVTDSGGVQEEGPSLGKPILVLREKTERPEAVEAGTVKLVGSDPDRIADEANRLLDDADLYQSMTRIHNPYGDGLASRRIRELIRSFFSENNSRPNA